MPTLFHRMPELTPSPIKRARQAELEFGAPRVELPLPVERRPLSTADEDWSDPIRGLLLDARLQRAIRAAANGWVVERFD